MAGREPSASPRRTWNSRPWRTLISLPRWHGWTPGYSSSSLPIHERCFSDEVGRFLACGIPCLSNAGIGDFDHILEGGGAGIILKDLSTKEKVDGVRRLLDLVRQPGTRLRCAQVASECFSLDEGIRRYSALYRRLA